jgi:long-chain acyl-CoA synthetase
MVEEAILLHPAVAEATVCGVPDRHRGETIKAYVRLCDGAGLTAGELRAVLRDKLAPFEQPKAIEFRSELPLTSLGKPSRRDLVAEEIRRLNAEEARLSPPDQAIPDAQPAPAA